MAKLYTLLLCAILLFSTTFYLNTIANNQLQTESFELSIETFDYQHQDTPFMHDSISINTDLPKSNENVLVADTSQFCYMIANHFDYKDSILPKYETMKQRNWQVLVYHVDKRTFDLRTLELDTLSWYDDCVETYLTSIMGVMTDSIISEKASVQEIDSNFYQTEVEYIYLSGLNRPDGEVPSHYHALVGIVPGDPYYFQFEGKQYILRAEGTVADYVSSDNELAYEVDYMGRISNYQYGYSNYQLYLECEGVVQMLNSDTYDNTSLAIYFIGDLDGDGKPDFLFDTNKWYEGSEVTLFLSSMAAEGELVKNMGTSGSYSPCW